MRRSACLLGCLQKRRKCEQLKRSLLLQLYSLLFFEHLSRCMFVKMSSKNPERLVKEAYVRYGGKVPFENLEERKCISLSL